jgi:hypothetical protein
MAGRERGENRNSACISNGTWYEQACEADPVHQPPHEWGHDRHTHQVRAYHSACVRVRVVVLAQGQNAREGVHPGGHKCEQPEEENPRHTRGSDNPNEGMPVHQLFHFGGHIGEGSAASGG